MVSILAAPPWRDQRPRSLSGNDPLPVPDVALEAARQSGVGGHEHRIDAGVGLTLVIT